MRLIRRWFRSLVADRRDVDFLMSQLNDARAVMRFHQQALEIIGRRVRALEDRAQIEDQYQAYCERLEAPHTDIN